MLGAGWHVFLWSIGRSPELRSLAGDEQTYWARAEIYLAGGEPAVDLMWPPLYRRFLSLCWSPLGRPSRLAVELVQVLLLAAAALLLARFARREGLPLPWAAAAGAALFPPPTPAAFAHYFWPEILHLALFLGALELLRGGASKIWTAAFAGGLLGLALLTKSLLTGFLPILLLLDFLAAERGKRWPRLAAIVAGLLLVICPTPPSNQRVIRKLTIADSSTFNLWVGLNDTSRQLTGSIAWRELQAWRASAPGFAERDALLRGRIARLVRDDGLGRAGGAAARPAIFPPFRKRLLFHRPAAARAAWRPNRWLNEAWTRPTRKPSPGRSRSFHIRCTGSFCRPRPASRQMPQRGRSARSPARDASSAR